MSTNFLRDWTKKERNIPFYDPDGKLFYLSYQSFADIQNGVTTNIIAAESRKAYKLLLNYYNKNYTEEDIEELYQKYSDDILYYIDPRAPEYCSGLLVLIKIEEQELEGFVDNDLSEQNLNFHKILVFDFDSARDNILEDLEFISFKLEKNSITLYKDDILLSFDKIISNFKEFYSNLKYVSSINFRQNSSVEFYYDDEFKVRFLKDERGEVGAEEVSLLNKDFLSFKLFINRDQFDDFNRRDWKEEFINIVGDDSLNFRKEDDSTGILEKLLHKHTIDLSSIPDEYKTRLKDLARGLSFEKCDVQLGDDQIVRRLYKNSLDVNAETEIIKDRVFREKIFNANEEIRDFVGDEVFMLQNSPRDLDDLYNEVLNKVSLETLIDKSVKCLLGRTSVTVPAYCVEAYTAFVIDIPSLPTSGFPSAFSFVSRIAERAFYFVLSKALQAIISSVFNLLNECENQGGLAKILEESGKIPEESLGEDYNSVVDKINKRHNIDAKSFLDDLFSVLTLNEICKLFDGISTQNTYQIVSCMIRVKYSNLESVTEDKSTFDSFFKSIGSIAGLENCADQIEDPIPGDSLFCDDEVTNSAREALLRNNYNLSDSEIRKQLEQASQRRQSELEFFENFSDSSLSPEKIQELVIERLPSANELDQITEQAELTIDTVLQSQERTYDTALSTVDLYGNTSDIREIKTEIGFESNSQIIGDVRDFEDNAGNIYRVSGIFNPDWTINQMALPRLTYDFSGNQDIVSYFLEDGPIVDRQDKSENSYGITNNRETHYTSLFWNFNTNPTFDGEARYQAAYKNVTRALENVIYNKIIELEGDIQEFTDVYKDDAESLEYDFLQNCWEDGEDIEVGALERFKERYDETKSSEELNNVIASSIFYYSFRFSLLNIAFKIMNYGDFIEDYRSDGFVWNLYRHYLQDVLSKFDKFKELEKDARGQDITFDQIFTEQLDAFKKEYQENRQFDDIYTRLFKQQIELFRDAAIDLADLDGTNTGESLDNNFYLASYFQKEDGSKISVARAISEINDPSSILSGDPPEALENGEWVMELRVFLDGVLNLQNTLSLPPDQLEDLLPEGVQVDSLDHLGPNEFLIARSKSTFEETPFNLSSIYDFDYHFGLLREKQNFKEMFEYTFPINLLFEIFTVDLYLFLNGKSERILPEHIKSLSDFLDQVLDEGN